MIKAIHFIKRKPGMELEAFRAYWLGRHAELVSKVADYVRRHLPANMVFDTVVPRTVAAADAFAAGQPVVLRNPSDAAAQSYVNLATTLVERFL